MSDARSNDSSTPIGLSWLRQKLQLAVPAPAIESYIVQGARRTEVRGRSTIEFYPRRYATDDTVVSHLRFAFRHEPVDIGVLVAALKKLDPTDIAASVQAEPPAHSVAERGSSTRPSPGGFWTSRTLARETTSKRLIPRDI